MSALARGLDRALEATIALSFTRVGPALRRSAAGWQAPPAGALEGRRVLITGATSGLGLHAAEQVLRLGGELVMVARDEAKGARVAAELASRTGRQAISVLRADVSELGDVRRVCAELLAGGLPLHALVHNAGALDDDFRRTSEGIEKTVAAHVVGPFLMTELLRPALAAAGRSRVLWVSSGGMYAEPLRVQALEMSPERYDGVVAYARAKRAQVTLAEALAEALHPEGILVHAMHPGWVDTPGVERSLPRFRALLRPLLRSADEGTDTLLFLMTAPEQALGTGGFWLDRERRPLHLMEKTRRSDTPEERARLLAWVRERAGLG